MSGRPAKPAQDAGHRQRLREKYFRQGIDGLSDEEIIELLLTLGTTVKDCKPSARAALKEFGSLAGVLEADSKSLEAIPGLGPKNILGLKLVHETARRFLRQRLIGRDFLHSPKEVFDYLYHSLRQRQTEALIVVYLSAKNAVLAVEEPFGGGSQESHLQPQLLLRRALGLGASSLVVVHNHPSGQTQPSSDDIKATRQLVLAAHSVDLRLIDHLIIGHNRYYSFAETGHISRFEDEFESFKKGAGY